MEHRSESRTLSSSTLAAGMEAVATQHVKIEQLSEKETMEKELKDRWFLQVHSFAERSNFEFPISGNEFSLPRPRVLSSK